MAPLMRPAIEEPRTPEALARLLAGQSQRASTLDEVGVLNAALSCPAAWWRIPGVRDAAQGAAHANENLRFAFGLLTGSPLDCGADVVFDRLLARRNSH